MIYVVSDIHGCYEKFQKMLELIKFNDKDTLYILGDVIDRGKNGIKILTDTMKRSNVVFIMGNHEYMALKCLPFLLDDPQNAKIQDMEYDDIRNLQLWIANRCGPTVKELAELTKDERIAVYKFLQNAKYYEKVNAGGNSFILSHGVIDNYELINPLEEYDPESFLYGRPSENPINSGDKLFVFGHTPVQFLNDDNKILYRDNLIDIDCGCVFDGGQLACLCLDTLEEFYI